MNHTHGGIFSILSSQTGHAIRPSQLLTGSLYGCIPVPRGPKLHCERLTGGWLKPVAEVTGGLWVCPRSQLAQSADALQIGRKWLLADCC